MEIYNNDNNIFNNNTESNLLDDYSYVITKINTIRKRQGITVSYKNRSENEKEYQRKRKQKILTSIIN